MSLICAWCGEEIRASRKTIEVDTRPPVRLTWHWLKCLSDPVVGDLVNSETREQRRALVAVVEARGPGRIRRSE